jgi:hypothetical protein
VNAEGAPLIRWTRHLSILALAGVVLAAAGWLATDALERDNDFCNACHIRPDLPLHLEIRRDFDLRPAESLAALHAATPVEGRPAAPSFRCIDCHGGVGLMGRARVKALAAKDAFWWMVGHFGEPEEMHWPLLDADCRQCHAEFAERGTGFGDPAFHDLPVHNVDLGVGCVECHRAHGPGGNSSANFLHPVALRLQCAACHTEFQD